MAVEPYTLSDELGSTIEVLGCNIAEGRHGFLKVSSDDGSPEGATASACVDPLNIPGLMTALYEVCGKQPPVILARPDLPLGTGDDHAPVAGFDVWRAAGRVYLADVEEAAIGLAPPAARMLAAALVLHADAAETDPDPVDVADLGVLVLEVLGELPVAASEDGTGLVTGLAERIAEKILRGGYRKQPAP